MSENPPLIISNNDELVEFCSALSNESWITVDTEFLREKTYYPELCLVQIASADQLACIDPIALDDLGPLWELLYNASITKVMHACKQDMEIFYCANGSLPTPIFDTQVAAPLLGLGEQLGYGPLVKAILGVNLSKGHSRTNWARRPLSSAQLQYAADDVRYLAQLYPKVRDQLKSLGRIAWLDDDFAALTDSRLYENPPDKAWQRLRNLHRMKSDALAIVQALAGWRENLAKQENRPRGWLLKDEDLINIARVLPKNIEDLLHIRGPKESIIRKHSQDILAIIADSQQQKPQALPEHNIPNILTPPQEAMVDVLMAVLRLKGQENQLHPTALASRKQLEALVHGERKLTILEGWRHELAGRHLLDFLDGKLSVQANQNELEFAVLP